MLVLVKSYVFSIGERIVSAVHSVAVSYAGSCSALMRLVSGGTEFWLEAPLRRRLEAGSSVDACLLLSLVRARRLNKWRFLLQSIDTLGKVQGLL